MEKLEADELLRLAATMAQNVVSEAAAADFAADLLMHDESVPLETRGKLSLLVEQIRSAARPAKRFLMISQSQCNTIETTKLYEYLSDLSILFRRLLAPNIDFQIRLAADLWPVRANMAALEQALITLVVKARDAMPMGGSLLFHARNMDEATCRSISGLYLSDDHVLIEIIDTGVGIAPEYLKRIFDPFFVTKGPVNGIALAKAYWAIKDMNGHLTVKSAIGKGTRFNMFMPRAPS